MRRREDKETRGCADEVTKARGGKQASDKLARDTDDVREGLCDTIGTREQPTSRQGTK